MASQQEYLVYLQNQAAMQNYSGMGLGGGTANGYYQPVVYDPNDADPLRRELAKKKKRFIVELREELRKWHGDLYSVLD